MTYRANDILLVRETHPNGSYTEAICKVTVVSKTAGYTRIDVEALCELKGYWTIASYCPDTSKSVTTAHITEFPALMQKYIEYLI